MSTNCLVTKLKDVVDNNNLKKLGIARMKIFTTGSMTVDNKYLEIKAASTGPVKIVCPDGEYMTPSTTGVATASITIPAGSSIGISLSDIGANGNYVLEIEKYNLEYIRGGAFVVSNINAKRLLIEDLDYANNFTESPLLYGGFSELPYLPALTTLQITSANATTCDFTTLAEKYKNSTKLVTLDLAGLSSAIKFKNITVDNIKKLSNVSTLKIGYLYSCISGNIKGLGNLPLTSLSLNDNSVLTGSLEEFVARRRGHGAPTGSITIPYIGNLLNVTFNSSALSSVLSKKTLAWTASEITFNGTTVQNSAVDSDN